MRICRGLLLSDSNLPEQSDELPAEDKNEPIHLPPPMFSRMDVPFNYKYDNSILLYGSLTRIAVTPRIRYSKWKRSLKETKYVQNNAARNVITDLLGGAPIGAEASTWQESRCVYSRLRVTRNSQRVPDESRSVDRARNTMSQQIGRQVQ
jgi:hypothetical protein